jgi:hypothetical protein
LRIFLGFSDTGVNSGTAVMARQTGRRDRGVRRIPGVVADRGAEVTHDGRRPERRRCRRDSRHARRRKGIGRGFEKGLNKLSGKVFENTRGLLGDLLGAKNVGVTVTLHMTQ